MAVSIIVDIFFQPTVTNSRFGVEFETSWAGPSVVANIRLLRRYNGKIFVPLKR